MYEIERNLLSNESLKLLSLVNIPKCTAETSQFDSELWPGLISRLHQMTITGCSEHRINWNIKKGFKSTGNMLFLRGDDAFDTDTSTFKNC